MRLKLSVRHWELFCACARTVLLVIDALAVRVFVSAADLNFRQDTSNVDDLGRWLHLRD
jgi:hypothetical protein